jgi:hypothetical protein
MRLRQLGIAAILRWSVAHVGFSPHLYVFSIAVFRYSLAGLIIVITSQPCRVNSPVSIQLPPG